MLTQLAMGGCGVEGRLFIVQKGEVINPPPPLGFRPKPQCQSPTTNISLMASLFRKMPGTTAEAKTKTSGKSNGDNKQRGDGHNNTSQDLKKRKEWLEAGLSRSSSLRSVEEGGKEKKSSWVKTIGMRTLRLRRAGSKKSSLPPEFLTDVPSLPTTEPPLSLVTTNAKPEAKSSPKPGVKKDVVAKPGAPGELPDKQDPARFIGEGMTFKGKLIGVLEVSGPRGDRICQEALSELKMAVKAAGEHKQKILIYIALDGLRIRDEKTGDCLYHHQVHKISFIAQDLTDARAFGYIFGSPDTGHRFFGIKTDKSAGGIVIAMRDLFQVVFDLKKKEIERAKQQLELQQKYLATRATENNPKQGCPNHKIAETYIEGACALPPKAEQEVDLLNLEVELNSLQEGLENIHHSFVDPGLRGSSASISSDSVPPLSAGLGKPSTMLDPFGDSFDPFEGNNSMSYQKFGNTASALGSPFPAFDVDPFVQVDPFPGLHFPSDSSDFPSDPFDNGGFEKEPIKLSASIHPVNGESSSLAAGWAASFEDNFVPDDSKKDLEKVDIFRDLDPLGSGRVRPLVDRKDFFQDLKNPPKKSMNDFNEPCSSTTQLQTTSQQQLQHQLHQQQQQALQIQQQKQHQIEQQIQQQQQQQQQQQIQQQQQQQQNQQKQQQSQQQQQMSNSFSSNFNPHSGERESRSESPPSYAPPPPPSSGNSSEYFTAVLPVITFPNTLAIGHSRASRVPNKKSPSLLKQITIANEGGPSKTLPRPRMNYSFDCSAENAEIPNLTPPPPPRPPHTLQKHQSCSSAVPRPNSGSGGYDRLKKTYSLVPPEPPPRPFATESLVSPPPLPPKKSISLPPTSSNEKVVNRTLSVNSNAENDLPLPLPSRRRYGYPLHSTSICEERPLPAVKEKISMEAALNQVASLSLGQLAQKLALPVEKLATLTIHQLAEKLSDLEIASKESKTGNERRGNFERSHFEKGGNFEDDEDEISTVSAPAGIPQRTPAEQDRFDKYAVFRELTVEDASGFSLANENKDLMDELDVVEKDGSRDSSSERTLQADGLVNPAMATLDDITDANLSDDHYDEDEKGDWATFESNFEDFLQEQSLSLLPEESPKIKAQSSSDSDDDESPRTKEKLEKLRKKSFDFQPFDKEEPERDDLRRNKKNFIRQNSSGSSRHSGADKSPVCGSNYRFSDHNNSDQSGTTSRAKPRVPPTISRYEKPKEGRRETNSDESVEEDEDLKYNQRRKDHLRNQRRRNREPRDKYDRCSDDDDFEDDRSYHSNYSSNSRRSDRRYPERDHRRRRDYYEPRRSHNHYHNRRGNSPDESPEELNDSYDEKLEKPRRSETAPSPHGQPLDSTARRRERDQRDFYDRNRDSYHHDRDRDRRRPGSSSSRRHGKHSPREARENYYRGSREGSDYSDEPRDAREVRNWKKKKNSRENYDNTFYSKENSFDSESNPDEERSERLQEREVRDEGKFERGERRSSARSADHRERTEKEESLYLRKGRRPGSGRYKSDLTLNSSKKLAEFRDDTNSSTVGLNHGRKKKRDNLERKTSPPRNLSDEEEKIEKVRETEKLSEIVREIKTLSEKDEIGENENDKVKMTKIVSEKENTPTETNTFFDDNFDSFIPEEPIEMENHNCINNIHVGTNEEENLKKKVGVNGEPFFPTHFEEEEDEIVGEIPDLKTAGNRTGKMSEFGVGRRLESIRSEEERGDEENSEGMEEGEMKKSDSFNIFKETRDPFADDFFN